MGHSLEKIVAAYITQLCRNDTLHRATERHQLVAEITPFSYYFRSWYFGRVMLPAFVWPISTGSKLELMSPAKGGAAGP